MAKKSLLHQSDTSAEILMLAFLCIKGVETLQEKVGILDRFGLSDADISLICNATIGSVRNTRLEGNKQPKSK